MRRFGLEAVVKSDSKIQETRVLRFGFNHGKERVLCFAEFPEALVMLHQESQRFSRATRIFQTGQKSCAFGTNSEIHQCPPGSMREAAGGVLSEDV